MEVVNKKLNKWELSRYLIDAKKGVDSIIFIEDNKAALLNIGIQKEIDHLRQEFYINCGEILDTRFPKGEKKRICEANETVRSIYYERDKHAAHKDVDYKPKDYVTLMAMVEEMKSQLACVRQLCAEVLPDVVTLDFVSHDKKLFRQIHHITPEIEEQIKRLKHPMYGQIPKGAKMLPPKKVFYDTEKIRQIPESERKDYAVIIDSGINFFEGVQSRQDGCINFNVLYGENMWANINPEGIAIHKRLMELGYYNQFDFPQMMPDDDPRLEEIAELLKKRHDLVKRLSQ